MLTEPKMKTKVTYSNSLALSQQPSYKNKGLLHRTIKPGIQLLKLKLTKYLFNSKNLFKIDNI